jgi:hypothetical protein
MAYISPQQPAIMSISRGIAAARREFFVKKSLVFQATECHSQSDN